MAEQVLVVRRASCFGGDWPQGYLPMTASDVNGLLSDWTHLAFFTERGAAEVDPSLKQIIPYCVVCRDDGREVLTVRRRKAGTEARLHGLYSVGIGGHVGPEDGPIDGLNLLQRALLRELQEELWWPVTAIPAPRPIGLIHDDSTAVGQVHTGLVFRADLPAAARHVKIREKSKLEGGFLRLVELRDLWQDPRRFESWSRLVLEAMFKLRPRGIFPSRTQASDQGIHDREEPQHGRTHPGS